MFLNIFEFTFYNANTRWFYVVWNFWFILYNLKIHLVDKLAIPSNKIYFFIGREISYKSNIFSTRIYKECLWEKITISYTSNPLTILPWSWLS